MIQDMNQKSETLRKLHEEDGKVMKNIREFIDRIGGSRKVFEMNNKPFLSSESQKKTRRNRRTA